MLPCLQSASLFGPGSSRDGRKEGKWAELQGDCHLIHPSHQSVVLASFPSTVPTDRQMGHLSGISPVEDCHLVCCTYIRSNTSTMVGKRTGCTEINILRKNPTRRAQLRCHEAIVGSGQGDPRVGGASNHQANNRFLCNDNLAT
jgi:hypothetical protein